MTKTPWVNFFHTVKIVTLIFSKKLVSKISRKIEKHYYTGRMVYGGRVNGHAYWRNSANSYAIWNDSDSGKYENLILGLGTSNLVHGLEITGILQKCKQMVIGTFDF